MLSPSLFYSSLEVNEKQTSQIDLGFLFSATPFVFSRSLAVVAVLLVNLAHVAILPQLMLCLRQVWETDLPHLLSCKLETVTVFLVDFARVAVKALLSLHVLLSLSTPLDQARDLSSKEISNTNLRFQLEDPPYFHHHYNKSRFRCSKALFFLMGNLLT